MRVLPSSWTHTLTALGRKRKPIAKKRRTRAGRRFSVIERLEDRALMAVFTVDSLQDNTTSGDGVTTLREAIASANGNFGNVKFSLLSR
jgi:hypothetical protein